MKIKEKIGMGGENFCRNFSVADSSLLFFFFLSDVDGGWKIYRLLKNNKMEKNGKLKSFCLFFSWQNYNFSSNPRKRVEICLASVRHFIASLGKVT